jgi:hypothetical protein
MALLNTPCGSTVKTLRLGDEAFRAKRINTMRKDTDVAVVRQGAAIAIYWSGLPGPDTVAHDAATMVARLKALGY